MRHSIWVKRCHSDQNLMHPIRSHLSNIFFLPSVSLHIETTVVYSDCRRALPSVVHMHLRRRFPPLPFTLIALLLALQSTPSTSQCIPLRGSSLCPRYQSLSINPGNLSSSWPFFDAVVDTTSFDVEFARYLTPGGQFAKTKQGTQLGCSGWDVGDSVLQYQRTFLVSVISFLHS